jgi:UDP-N-acetylglucosamine--N-acetylmuramyl-(pentapeptide) pyrophosphoryl-undecaprenol N-acetylglucosamine transferase
MSRAPHLVVMAAGTGGHIMPGLAVAREMQSRGWTVSWLGTTHGMENRLVPPTGIELDRVDFQGLRGKGWLHTLAGVFKLGAAFVRCAAILRRRRANAVLGMGGYVCFPGGVAARFTGRPLVLVNADAGLLLSNRSLSRMAQRMAFGFEGEASRQMPQAVVTGNPVRADIEALPEPAVRWAGRQGPLRLLVVGGSLGAQVLNRVVPAALAALPAESRPQILHQTGLSQQAEVASAYAQAGIAADVRPFIDDMAEALADCDLVICRAGAITVSELCAAGVPSILVPLIVSTTSHQRDNALWLERQGAAWHLPQAELNVQRLVELLQTLDRPALLARAERARAAARPRAAARVADLIEPLLPLSLGARGASA